MRLIFLYAFHCIMGFPLIPNLSNIHTTIDVINTEDIYGEAICHKQQILRQLPENAWKPSCNKAGHFQPTQCNLETRQCWCSERNGSEISGSRVHLNSVDELESFKCLKTENADTFFPKFEIFGHSEINEEGKAVTIIDHIISKWIPLTDELRMKMMEKMNNLF